MARYVVGVLVGATLLAGCLGGTGGGRDLVETGAPDDPDDDRWDTGGPVYAWGGRLAVGDEGEHRFGFQPVAVLDLSDL